MSEKSVKNRLIENVLSLGILQCANYFLPLLTLPYLVRVLGPDYFGLLAFATAMTMYISLLTDYGFNLSATRQISIHRNDNRKVCEIFSSVMIIKSFLMLTGFIAMVLLVTLVDKFSEHWKIYILSLGVVIGQVLLPMWFFQGMEMMKYITFVNIFSKLIFTLLVFIFVRSKSDYLLVPIFNSLGSIMGGLWALIIVLDRMSYKLAWPGLGEIKYQLKDGWHVFLSTIATSLYTVSNVLILGLLTSNSAVGQFAAVEKIIQAVKAIYQPIGQAVYPLMAQKFYENKLLALQFIKKLCKIAALSMTILSAFLYIFSDSIVNLILGNQYSDAATLLKTLSPLPLIITLSNILGIQIMLNLGLKSAFSIILTAAGLLGVALSLLLVPLFQERGTAYAMLTVEILVTVSMFFCVKNNLKSNH